MSKSIKNSVFALIAVTGIALITPSAGAVGLMLEPYLGYYTGKAKQTGSTDSDLKGTAFGARIGLQSLGLMAGADYLTGSWKMSSSGSADMDFKPTQLGLFVGYNFPVLLRAYAEYVLQAKGKVSYQSYNNTYEGKGIKLGVGATPFPMIAINLEYMSNSYDKDSGGTLTNKVEEKTYGLTISVPLSF